MSEPAPILRVTVGTPVYAQDGEKIGTVKEVRGQAFKVETGLLQKDYWLPGESVAEAVPDAALLLPDLEQAPSRRTHSAPVTARSTLARVPDEPIRPPCGIRTPLGLSPKPC